MKVKNKKTEEKNMMLNFPVPISRMKSESKTGFGWRSG
jgi:hypothetical protein